MVWIKLLMFRPRHIALGEPNRHEVKIMLRAVLVLVVLFTVFIPISHADESENISFQRYAMVGPVDAIDINDYSIVVGDVQMRLTTDVRIRDPNGRHMALGQIQPGMRVGLVSEADARGTSKLISEIHVLSASYAGHGSED